jgi:hypothetical protein
MAPVSRTTTKPTSSKNLQSAFTTAMMATEMPTAIDPLKLRSDLIVTDLCSIAVQGLGRAGSPAAARRGRRCCNGMHDAGSEALSGDTDWFGTASIDSSHVKAHRSAARGKGGRSRKPSPARATAARPRSTR